LKSLRDVELGTQRPVPPCVPADLLVFAEVGGMTYGIVHLFAVWGVGQLSVGLWVMVRRE
jgi:hypothetical protein